MPQVQLDPQVSNIHPIHEQFVVNSKLDCLLSDMLNIRLKLDSKVVTVSVLKWIFFPSKT